MTARRWTPPLLALLFACSWPGGELAAAPPATAPSSKAPSSKASFVVTPPVPMMGAALEARITSKADHVRVFNFWATWCGPCIAELPGLLAFARAHPTVELVLVNVDHKSQQARRVATEIEHRGLLAVNNVLLDSTDPNVDLKAHVAGWPESIPTTLVIARDGTRTAMLTEAIVGQELEQAVARADHP
ncbi:MAG: TlpA family protein disulfide reductase [Alphaproteobacteria bacterium]|nr:TlpA family protein disulfide reductase [Alphaproteobacteria bacterium]